MRILGIDPGFDRLGVCVLEKEGAKDKLIFSTCITTSKKDSFESRLLSLGGEFSALIKEYSPQELALEKLFFSKNQTTAMQVAEVRGVLIYLAHQAKMSIHEYSPSHIKLAVAGHGNAHKNDIARMVPLILGLRMTKPLIDDEMDAIAIALTHSAHQKSASWK